MPRRELVGTVVSDKMAGTVVVEVESRSWHPRYFKLTARKKRFLAHTLTPLKLGDRVRLREARPLSRLKRWQVIEVIKK